MKQKKRAKRPQSFPMREFSELQKLFRAETPEELLKPPRKERRRYLKGPRRRLAERHVSTAFSVARRYRTTVLGREERVSAALHGVCLAALNYRDSIRKKYSFQAYAEICAVKEIRRDVRAFYRWLKKHGSPAADEPHVNGDTHHLDNRDDVDLILKCMQKMNPRHQELVRLHVAGASSAEIAELTGYSVQVARTTLNYAIDRLVDIVNQQRS